MFWRWLQRKFAVPAEHRVEPVSERVHNIDILLVATQGRVDLLNPVLKAYFERERRILTQGGLQ